MCWMLREEYLVVKVAAEQIQYRQTLLPRNSELKEIRNRQLYTPLHLQLRTGSLPEPVHHCRSQVAIFIRDPFHVDHVDVEFIKRTQSGK